MSGEFELTPLNTFVFIIIGSLVALTAIVAGIGDYLPPQDIVKPLELWHNGEVMTNDTVYGPIFEFTTKRSLTVEIRNPSTYARRFQFTHGVYPSNLSISITYSHIMPVAIPRGGTILFGIEYWVAESNVTITETDVWFIMEAM